MKLSKIVLLGAAAAAAGGCGKSGDLGVVNPGPMAMVRFINAVPDTGAVNFRFVDKLENLPTFLAVPFRGGSGLYQGVQPGSRHIRVFPLDTTIAGASTRIVDTTTSLDVSRRYTILHAGSARAPTGDPTADRLVFIQDTIPTPAGDSIAVRVIHAAVGTGPVDVYVGATGTNPVTTPVYVFRNVAYLGRTPYVSLPVRRAGAADSLYTFAVTDAGGTTALFSSTPNEPGTPASGSVSAQAGVRIRGSVLTAVVFPGATPGSRAATSSNTTRAVALFLDNIPGLP